MFNEKVLAEREQAKTTMSNIAAVGAGSASRGIPRYAPLRQSVLERLARIAAEALIIDL